MTELLDREEFRLWLATREPDEVVGGMVGNPGCAVEQYVEKALGFHDASAGFSCIYAIDDDGETVGQGWVSWMWGFVIAHDNLAAAKEEQDETGVITAKEALTILDSIPETHLEHPTNDG